MPLERYALGGHEEWADSFCYWMEFKSLSLGSIRGGSSHKLIIYKHKDQPGWHFPKQFSDEHQAWEALRGEFLKAFELADAGQWDAIANLPMLESGPALLLKTMHLYFPDQVLPAYSGQHLKHFLRLVGHEDAAESGSRIQMNRALLTILRAQPALGGWNTNELQWFLYEWAHPNESKRVYKIAPGRDAKFWDECRDGGFICVGWDEIGDLMAFDSKQAFRDRFSEVCGAEYNNHRPAISKKANELWALRELEPGDLIVANQGVSKVLAIGEVVEPGYQYRAEREKYRHTVAVEWDTSYERTIPAQKGWAMVTVAKVPDALIEQILSRTDERRDAPRTKAVPVPPIYGRLASALERKGQVILYGPPGTGKTYTARRFATWWLTKHGTGGDADAVLGDSQRLEAAERQLSAPKTIERVWWMVANPKQWSWDLLFKDGAVEYRYGRLQRNYPLVRKGDLVVGYQSRPDSRIVALARITREFGREKGGAPTIELEPLTKVANGPTYDELSEDPILSVSEPMRFRNQGTLFRLTADEAQHLMSLLEERNPELRGITGSEEADSMTTGAMTRVTFHPSYTYEDFVEGFRPVEQAEGGLVLRLEDGVFKRVCRAAQGNPEQPFLILIDEINRGNVAKVLGELITLLERDKRGLSVTLPQSKESFSIPPNVYVLATMNTADRNIKLLDAALRRRFAFIELMPDAELLRGATVGALALDDFLDELNRRIAESEGREKQIGHSYLLQGGQAITDPDEFAQRFREEILPLLQEYCYEDYATLARYIGTALVDANGRQLEQEKLDDPEQLIAALSAELGSAEPADQ